MKKNKVIAAILVALAVCIAAPREMSAATLAWTASMKSSFDKIIVGADSTLRSKLTKLNDDIVTLNKQDQDWDERIKASHYKNEEALIAVRKQINEIDADKLDKLELQVVQTKDRYKRLFAFYDSINQQISAAKALGSKQLNAALRAQADGMKVPVQLARQDIQSKQRLLTEAKAAAAKTKKDLRGILADIEPVNVQMKAGRAAAANAKKKFSAGWETLKQALKKNDAKRTSDSLDSLAVYSRQIVQQKQNLHALEQKISDIIGKAKAKMPPDDAC